MLVTGKYTDSDVVVRGTDCRPRQIYISGQTLFKYFTGRQFEFVAATNDWLLRHTQAHDTRQIKIGRYCRPTNVGRFFPVTRSIFLGRFCRVHDVYKMTDSSEHEALTTQIQ